MRGDRAPWTGEWGRLWRSHRKSLIISKSAERKHASSYGGRAFNLGGGVDWKNKINDVMSKFEAKVEGKEVCVRSLAAYMKE